MRVVIIVLFIFIYFTTHAQDAVVSKGEIPLGIQVIDLNTKEPMDIAGLCQGFDEDGLPIRLLLPYYAKLMLFVADTIHNPAITYHRIVDVPVGDPFDVSSFQEGLIKIEPRSFIFKGHQVGLAYSRPLDNNEIKRVRIVKRKKLNKLTITRSQPLLLDKDRARLGDKVKIDSAYTDGQQNIDTLSFVFFGDYHPVDIEEAYLDSEMAELMANTTNRDPLDLSTRSYEKWAEKGYANIDEKQVLPQNPRFPHTLNTLFVKISRVTDELEITLEKDGEKLPRSPVQWTGRVLILSNLTGGDYKLIVTDPRIKYGSQDSTYEFSIKSEFWHQGGYWLAILLPLFLILFLVYRTYTKAKLQRVALTQKLTNAELTAIRSQLNPHFLFNSLNAIQNLVNKPDNEKANNYIVKLSRLMRLVLNRSNESFHSLQNELEIAENYLELECLRSQFNYEIKVGNDVDKNMLVPTMLLQPYLENAVIHGVVDKGADLILVEINVSAGFCHITVQDNGVGQSMQKGNGKGMSMSADRLKVIERQHGIKTTVNAQATKTGYVVKIQFPNNL